MEVAVKAKESQKVFWNHVKKKTVKQEYFLLMMMMAGSDKQKADILSVFYSSIFFTKETSNELPDLIPRTIDQLSIDIDEEPVYHKLQRLNVRKSCGSDDLHPWLIRPSLSSYPSSQ